MQLEYLISWPFFEFEIHKNSNQKIRECLCQLCCFGKRSALHIKKGKPPMRALQRTENRHAQAPPLRRPRIFLLERTNALIALSTAFSPQ